MAIDGVKTFKSINKSCANCLTRVVNKTTHYFHWSEIMNYENILSGLKEVYKAHVIEEIDWLKLLVTSRNELWSEMTIKLKFTLFPPNIY